MLQAFSLLHHRCDPILLKVRFSLVDQDYWPFSLDTIGQNVCHEEAKRIILSSHNRHTFWEKKKKKKALSQIHFSFVYYVYCQFLSNRFCYKSIVGSRGGLHGPTERLPRACRQWGAWLGGTASPIWIWVLWSIVEAAAVSCGHRVLGASRGGNPQTPWWIPAVREADLTDEGVFRDMWKGAIWHGSGIWWGCHWGAPATRLWISGWQWMDGWMDEQVVWT